MPSASRTGRIPNTEWPAIVARRQAGETYAAIARDYDVTGPAIKYIVDKAQAEGVTGARAGAAPVDAGATPETASAPKSKTISIADLSSSDRTPSDRTPSVDAAAQPRETRPEAAMPEDTAAPRTEPAPAVAADTPLARRLLDAANDCAALVAQAEKGAAGIDESAKAALHQVRRAVAAIEIEMSRGAAPARAPIPQRRPSQPQEAPPPQEARRPKAATQSPALDVPSNDGGGFGTHVVQGTVKFFHADKGFGFVIPDGGGSDIYVPLKALRGSGLATLESEQRVRVSVTRGAKGPEAKEIEPLAA